jgi:hypothetical protein
MVWLTDFTFFTHVNGHNVVVVVVVVVSDVVLVLVIVDAELEASVVVFEEVVVVDSVVFVWIIDPGCVRSVVVTEDWVFAIVFVTISRIAVVVEIASDVLVVLKSKLFPSKEVDAVTVKWGSVCVALKVIVVVDADSVSRLSSTVKIVKFRKKVLKFNT